MPSLVALAFKVSPFAMTLMTKELSRTKDFYEDKLGLRRVFEDEHSVIFACGETMLNFLLETSAEELIAPARLATSDAGVRAVYTLKCEDIDSAALELRAAGVSILNGPIDRPWGVRTVSFQDPDGHTWELANHD